jgi:hypothetical protein
MKLRQRFKGLMLAATVLGCLLCATAALAVPITYTFTGIGSGNWGGVGGDFVNADFAFSLSGDTSAVTYGFPLWWNNVPTNTINISGIGTGTAPGMWVWLDPSQVAVGISASVGDYMTILKYGVGLDVYDLKSSFAMISNADGTFLTPMSLATSIGDLYFTGYTQGSLSFAANAGAVPAPATLLLLGSGLIPLAWARRKKGWRK